LRHGRPATVFHAAGEEVKAMTIELALTPEHLSPWAFAVSGNGSADGGELT